MRKITIVLVLVFVSFFGFSQEYTFTNIVDLESSSVKSQGRTGTCWSFSTSSFLESEIKRISGKDIDISEMYTVRNTYPKKAWIYVMRQGKAQFSEGGLAHDVINSVAEYGLVPESVFSGLENGVKGHNHAEMVAVLKGMLDVYVKNPARKLSPRWKTAVEAVLDIYLGKNVSDFMFDGKKYTPISFQKMLGILPADYVTITSFAHQPNYSNFVLNIPDNFSNGSMYNVPLDEFEQVIVTALKKGFTVEIDIDVSEKGFSSKKGVAVTKRKQISTTYRQQEFENYTTTDDHLMHITGLVKDQNGVVYFKTKNSWGSDGKRIAYGGYVYMSSSYIRLKAISVMVHKDALTKKMANKIKL